MRVTHLKTKTKKKQQLLWRHSTFYIFLKKLNAFYCFPEFVIVTATTNIKTVLLVKVISECKMSVISIILTANFKIYDLDKVIFVVSGSKSILIIILLLSFFKFCVYKVFRYSRWRYWIEDVNQECWVAIPYKGMSWSKNWLLWTTFLHSVISLTECIGIVQVGKYRVVCLCVSVCVSVCLSVGARTPKLLGRFQ